MSQKNQRKLEKKIFRDFLKSKDFSDFEKDSLRLLRTSLFAAYNFYKDDYFENLKDQKGTINSLIENMDYLNKKTVKSLFKDAEYLSSNNFLNLLQDLLNTGQKLMEHLENVNNYRNFKLHGNFYEESVFTYHHGLKYLPKNVLNSLENKDFIDCGAYIGDSALVLETYFKPRSIHSFEPNNENFNFLLNTIESNNLRKVTAINKGVGNKRQELNFFPIAGASRVTNDDTDYKVEVITIDEYVFEKNLDVGLIKMDVEGFEIEALEGARQTIKKDKPILCLAIYHHVDEFIKSIKFIQELEMEYNIMLKHLSDFIPITETTLIAW